MIYLFFNFSIKVIQFSLTINAWWKLNLFTIKNLIVIFFSLPPFIFKFFSTVIYTRITRKKRIKNDISYGNVYEL